MRYDMKSKRKKSSDESDGFDYETGFNLNDVYDQD